MSFLGYQWLIREFGLPEHPLPIASMLGTRLREASLADGAVRREYPPHYAPDDSLTGHLEFALKHEGVNLAVLFDLFRRVEPQAIEAVVRAKPTGRYARLMGFFYEWLTGEVLDESLTVGGNYVSALDADACFVAPRPVRNRRWRIWDNLLGDPCYCLTLRRTEALNAALAAPLSAELASLTADFPAELFSRANDYLYLKETRSTYGIEHEPMPAAKRQQRFVSLLREAGAGSLDNVLSEPVLTERQNLIVDPRYAVAGFRTNQNYVGEQRPDFSQRIHYVCPPPQWLPEMMAGLASVAVRTDGLPALARAAVVAFGFVFIHPFEDGNGRLHRFLIHDVLHRDGFVGTSLMLPVSATMLRRMAHYDAALECYSRPLLAGWIEYELDQQGRMQVLNPDQVEGYYRFPDLTAQAEYLAQTVAMTIHEDMVEELRFLRGYDAARGAIRELVDMPDRRLDLLLQLLHQNGGSLSMIKREQFKELTDQELARIEQAFAESFAVRDL
jgi:hypothetical protein